MISSRRTKYHSCTIVLALQRLHYNHKIKEGTASYALTPIPSCHPMGIKAAATSETPRSVANRLNCAAAFLVSKTSTRIPSWAMCFLVSGLKGRLTLPTPMTNKSIYRGCQFNIPGKMTASLESENVPCNERIMVKLPKGRGDP